MTRQALESQPKLADSGTTQPHSSPRWDRAAIRFLVVFVVLVVIFGIVVRADWFDRYLLRSYTGFIASLSGSVLSTMGVDVKVDGSRIRSQTFAVEIRKGCDGLEAALLLLCATLAYPFSTFRTRLLALTSGYLLIFVFNLIRVVSLFLIGLHWPEKVEFVHTYIAQFAIILATMIFWLYWIARDRAGGRRTEAGAAAR